MHALRWRPGKRDFGCEYHVVSRFDSEGDRFQIDVFVMAKLREKRPLAITVGRYRDGPPVERRQLGFPGPQNDSAIIEDCTIALQDLGYDQELSIYRATQVHDAVIKDAAQITEAMKRAFGG